MFHPSFPIPTLTIQHVYAYNIHFTTCLGRFQIALVEVKDMALLMNAKLQGGPEGIYQANVFYTNTHKYDTSNRRASFYLFSFMSVLFLCIYVSFQSIVYRNTIHAVRSWNKQAKEKKKKKDQPFPMYIYNIYIYKIIMYRIPFCHNKMLFGKVSFLLLFLLFSKLIQKVKLIRIH